MIDSALNFINALTPYQWWLIGGFITSIPGVIGIVEWVRRHHLKVKGEELYSGFVVLNVTVWSFVLTAADAISANYSQITHLGSLLPAVAPFIAQYGPTLSIAALTTHTVATALLKWWKDRQAKKPINIEQLPSLAPAVEAVNTPIPAQSFGTQSAGVTTEMPPDNLFSL